MGIEPLILRPQARQYIGVQAIDLMLCRVAPLLGAQFRADVLPEDRDHLGVDVDERIERFVAGKHTDQLRDITVRDTGVDQFLHHRIDLDIERRIFQHQPRDEVADILAVLEPLIGFHVDFPEPPAALRGVFRFLARMELPITPEAFDDMEADISRDTTPRRRHILRSA